MKKIILVIFLLGASAVVWQVFPREEPTPEANPIQPASVDQHEPESIAAGNESMDLGRIAIPSADDDEVPAADAKPWYEDEEQIAKFLKAYERHLPRALAATEELRSAPRPTRQVELKEELDGKSGKTIFGMHFPGEYEGLRADTLTFAYSCIRLQNMRFAQWEASGKKMKELPDDWSLSTDPEEYPPSFFIYRIKGTTDLQFTPEQIEYVSRLKNQLIHELNAVQAREFETRPAVEWAGADMGTSLIDMSFVRKAKIIPEWKYLAETRLAARSRFVAALELFATTLQ